MKSIELNQIADVGKGFQAQAAQIFGTKELHQTVPRSNSYDQIIVSLSGVVAPKQLPRTRLIPVAANLPRLNQATGKVFGVKIGKSLHPAVITDRTTRNALHITYLADERDRLDPFNMQLTDLQKGLLKKIAVLQSPRVGAHTADGQGVGGEFGHQQLGIASALRPSLLQGQHAVHNWAQSSQGIAGAVTNPDIATIYDVTLPSGTRQVREVSATLTEGTLIDHPSFHEVDTFNLHATPQEFAAGLGVIAVSSQLGIAEVNSRIMENLQRL